MKPNRLLFLLALIAMCGVLLPAATLHGQNLEPMEPPADPVLRPVPEFSEWVERFTYEQEKQGGLPNEPTLPRTVTTTQTRGIVHEIIDDISGGKTEKWQSGNTFYLKPLGQTFWGEYDPSFQENNLSPRIQFQIVPQGRFRDLDWIQRANFAGFGKRAGAPVFYFTPLPINNVHPPASLENLPAVAVVDATTRMPILVRQDGSTRIFTFNEAPAAMQSLPSDLIQEIKEGIERRKKVFAAPKREY